MKEITYTIKFMKNVVWTLIINGLLALAVGGMILIYPALLPYLVAALLVVVGISCWLVAGKLNKYTTIHFKL